LTTCTVTVIFQANLPSLFAEQCFILNLIFVQLS
jgi:hypothetical protein